MEEEERGRRTDGLTKREREMKGEGGKERRRETDKRTDGQTDTHTYSIYIYPEIPREK